MSSIDLLELNMETLKALGSGVAFTQIQRLLAQAVADCRNRPGDARERTVSIDLKLMPKSHSEEDASGRTILVADGVGLKIVSDVKIPTRQTIEYDCGIGDGETLVFNPHSPHNHRQQNLPVMEDLDDAPSVKFGGA